MPRDERAAVRQKERSKLVITGVDARGLAFEERTEALDISEDGLACYLGHSVWMNSHLTAEVVRQVQRVVAKVFRLKRQSEQVVARYTDKMERLLHNNGLTASQIMRVHP